MPRPTSPKSAPLPPARPLWAALALSATGLVLAGLLVREHVQAHAGITSFCNINDIFNCDRVATSRYSVVLGIPVAVWGLFGYTASAVLALWGLRGRRFHPGWPRGLLFAFSTVSLVTSVALALVSELRIHSLCIFCMGSWLVSLLLFVASWRACRPARPGAALQADVAALLARPWQLAGLVALAAAVVGTTVAAYPHYWEGSPGARGAPGVATGAPGGKPAPAGSVTEVIVYSDYQCPFCARAHEQSRAVLAARPDLKVVHRQFPLDNTCNPALKRQVHPKSCELARAGICAEAQGRGRDMDDALFRNQEENAPLDQIAQRIGLDMGRFHACLDAPETQARLTRDIADGMRDQVMSTPTWVINGTARAGFLPVDLLPPKPGAQQAQK